MTGFMNYFGSMFGFLPCLFMYFPLSVIAVSILLTLLTRKAFISPIVVGLVYGSFFIYAYSQFNATPANFIIPLVAYIIISIFVSYLAKIPFKKR
jgi:hypothetical protein